MTEGRGASPGRWRAPVLAAVLLLAGAALFGRWFARPEVRFLTPLGKGEWIAPSLPGVLLRQRTVPVHALYRGTFRLAEPRAGGRATLRAFRDCLVRVDGVEAAPFAGDKGWRREREVRLPGPLSAGTHEVTLEVVNDDGPPLVKFSSPDLGLSSGKGWEIRLNDGSWIPVALASEPVPPEYPVDRGGVDSLLASLPLLLPPFLLGAALSLAAGAGGGRLRPALAFLGEGGRFRFALHAFWAFMAWHNIRSSPSFIGFDTEGHLDVVTFLLDRGRLPLPTELMMAWHPPLFPVVMAGFTRALADAGLARGLLLLLPLLCGALLVELSFRLSRLAFPGREDLQALATVFVGFSPVNVYMANQLNNEPVAALLSASAVVLAARAASSGEGGAFPRRALLAGLLLGASLLTKVSALLLLPPLVLVVALGEERRGKGWKGGASAGGVLAGAALAVSGWWYGGNLLRYGRLFLPNWERTLGKGWWQEPGYWTPWDLVRFGRSLDRPLLSGMGRVPDALHSTAWSDAWLSGLHPTPLWNYDLVSAGPLLGLLPAAAVLVGAWAALSSLRRDPGALSEPAPFSLLVASLFLGALLFAYMATPFYSGMKASHALGALPAFAVLAAAGFERICRPRLLRAAAWGTACAWVVAVAGAYLVQ